MNYEEDDIDPVYGACSHCGLNAVSCGAWAGGCRTVVEKAAEEAAEPCVVMGCSEPCASSCCACSKHWSDVPIGEQLRYHDAMAEVLSAPDVQRARFEIRSRVGAVLRGVRT